MALVALLVFRVTRKSRRTAGFDSRREPLINGAAQQMSATNPVNPTNAAPTPGYDDDTRPPGELPDTGWTVLPETFTLKTRDVRNYTVGQHVNNVGTDRNLSGTVVNIERSGSSGHMGTVTVQPGGGR